jgi:glutamine cyclotransferase
MAAKVFLFRFLVALFCLKFSFSNRDYTIKKTFPHDNKMFTQGITFYNGLLYQSGGLYGKSSLQIVHPDTGEVLQQQFLDKKYFGL